MCCILIAFLWYWIIHDYILNIVHCSERMLHSNVSHPFQEYKTAFVFNDLTVIAITNTWSADCRMPVTSNENCLNIAQMNASFHCDEQQTAKPYGHISSTLPQWPSSSRLLKVNHLLGWLGPAPLYQLCLNFLTSSLCWAKSLVSPATAAVGGQCRPVTPEFPARLSLGSETGGAETLVWEPAEMCWWTTLCAQWFVVIYLHFGYRFHFVRIKPTRQSLNRHS